MNKMYMDQVWIPDKSKVAAYYVTDYNSKKYIDSQNAYFVQGSDVKGGMGDDLIPFAKQDEANTFIGAHKGQIVKWDKINKDLIKTLDVDPVTGGSPHLTPQWRAMIMAMDEPTFFVCPKNAMKYYFGLDQFNKDKVWIMDVTKVMKFQVTDYNDKKYIDAKAAFYVKGSSVQSPQGEDLVPFATQQAAAAFAQAKGGEVISFDQISKDLLKTLKGKE